MVSRATFLGLGLGVISGVALTGCSEAPATTMIEVASPGPIPRAMDSRTGVLAVDALRPDGRYDTTLRRIEGGAYVTLTPTIPSGDVPGFESVAWFEGEALVGDLASSLYVFRDGAWTSLDLRGCDPSLSSASLMDATAMDHAWVMSFDRGLGERTLCLFDGVDFVSREPLDHTVTDLVEHDGRLFALDEEGVIRFRSIGEGSWTSIARVPDGTEATSLLARPDAVYVSSAGETSFVWSRIEGDAARVIEGMPGFDGERWEVEYTEQTHSSCGTSWFDGSRYCNEITDVAEHHVRRIDGDAPVDAGYLRLEDGDVTWYETQIVGPGQLILAGSSGRIFVTTSD
ncbi:MAG: hypothetical protein J0L92_13550 [Deltaproteobacteria bacterium]|nr:hypothetical protein [Deltaproteobacteria bacterium]